MATAEQSGPSPEPKTRRVWTTWAASTPGPAHLRARTPNQDCVAHGPPSDRSRLLRDGEFVAVSDGLGSRPRSHVGSWCACAAVKTIARLWRRNPKMRIETALRLLHDQWLRLIAPLTPAECAATCVFAIRIKGEVIVAQIGDGAALVALRSEEVVVISPDKTEDFVNMTLCLGATHREQDWRFVAWPEERVEAVLLCTDGVFDDLLPDHIGAFAREVVKAHRHMSPRSRAAELKRWLRDWPVPGHSDDKSLACLHAMEVLP